MEEFLEKNEAVSNDAESIDEESFEARSLEDGYFVDFEDLLKSDNLETVALRMTEDSLLQYDFMKKDILDRFLDFVYFKIQTGIDDIPSMAYPTKKIRDKELEKKIIDLINIHLYPEIVYRVLKFFTRNVHEADTNLYIANLIYSEDIIRSIYDTFKLLKKDIFITDPNERSLNVKKIQQFYISSDNRLSSPLDTTARLKYILEFFYIKYNIEHIYSKDDLMLSNPE